MPPTEGQQRLRATVQGFRIASVLITYAELGIAAALANGPRSLEELAAATSTDPQALERLLRAAVVLDLVRETPAGWENTPLATETLVPSSPYSLVHYISHQRAFYRRWGLLTEAVRTGQAPAASRDEERAPDWVRSFTLMLYEVARTMSNDIAACLLPLLAPVQSPRVLDVGGGHGEYAMALVRARPDLTATIFDLPPVLAITQELVSAQQLGHRVFLQPGDFTRDPLGTHYDLVLLFGVLNGMAEQTARELLRKIATALRPGGWLAIRATPPHPSPEAALQHALMDLQMLLATERGRMPDSETLLLWLKEAGLRDMHWRQVGEEVEVSLLLAQR